MSSRTPSWGLAWTKWELLGQFLIRVPSAQSLHLPQGHLPLLLGASHSDYLLSRKKGSCWSLRLENRRWPRGAAAGRALAWQMLDQVYLVNFILFGCLLTLLKISGDDVCVCAQLLSRVWLFATPWTVAHQAPLSMGFPRWEYWSRLPCPPPGDHLNRDQTLFSWVSCITGRFLTTEPLASGDDMCPDCTSGVLFDNSDNLLVFKIWVLALEIPLILESGFYMKVAWDWKVYE